MPTVNKVIHEPVAPYMSRLSLMGARFLEGNDGSAATPTPKDVAPQPATPAADTPPAGEGGVPKGSERAVLADLAKERDRRQALEAELATFQEQRAEAERAELSELERTKADLEAIRTDAETAQFELMRIRVAAKHGVTDEEDIDLFLTGKDEETLTKQAERLAARQASSGPATPKPDRTQGASGKEQRTPTSPGINTFAAGVKY